LSGGVPDGGDHEFRVPVVEAGEGVAQADAGAGGEAGGDLEDAPFAPGDGQLPVAPGGVHGLPVDLGHRGVVADGCQGVGEGPEVGAVQESAVTDQQFGAGFVGVKAGGVGAQRGDDRAGHRSSWERGLPASAARC
jgi:hypothetical protein